MSIADPWAVTNASAGGPPVEPLPEKEIAPRARGRIPHWLAVLCFTGIAALNLIWAFQPYGEDIPFDLSGIQHEYDFPVVTADNAVFFLAAAACAVLLAVPRTRAFARSFGIGFSAIWCAMDFMTLHTPRPERMVTTFSEWCVVGADALALPALICLLWAARAQARAAKIQPVAEAEAAPAAATEAAAATAHRPAARRSLALGLGVVGAVLYIVGDLLAWVRITSPAEFLLGAKPTSRTCCSFNQLTGHGKIDLIAGDAVLLLLVVLAATAAGRRAGRGGRDACALLAGVLPLLLSRLLQSVVETALPLESAFGYQSRLLAEAHQMPAPSDFVRTYSPVLGFWLALAGFALLALVVAHLAVRRARAAD